MLPNHPRASVVFYSKSKLHNTDLVRSLFNPKIELSSQLEITGCTWTIDTSKLYAWFLTDRAMEKDLYLNYAAVIVYCINLSAPIEKEFFERQLADLIIKDASLILLGIDENKIKIGYPKNGGLLDISTLQSVSYEELAEKILFLIRKKKDTLSNQIDCIKLAKNSLLSTPVSHLFKVCETNLPSTQTKAIDNATSMLLHALNDPVTIDKSTAIKTYFAHCEKYARKNSTLMQVAQFLIFVALVTALAGTIGCGIGLIIGGLLIAKAAILLTCGAGLCSGLMLGGSFFYPQRCDEAVMTPVKAVRDKALDNLA